MRDDAKAYRAINGLLLHLSPAVPGVDRWPDREDRAKPEIDAVAGPYAIEHTCVESFPGQNQDTSYFEALAAIEQEVAIDHGLFVVVPVGGFTRGTDWNAIVDEIRHWVADRSGALPIGHHCVSIDGVPFAIKAWRRDDSWSPGLVLAREDPGDDGFVDMLRAQAARKIAKLAPYKKAGKTTVLLLETRCVALMSVQKMNTGLTEAFEHGLPDGVDQVWFADWSTDSLPGYWRLR